MKKKLALLTTHQPPQIISQEQLFECISKSNLTFLDCKKTCMGKTSPTGSYSTYTLLIEKNPTPTPVTIAPNYQGEFTPTSKGKKRKKSDTPTFFPFGSQTNTTYPCKPSHIYPLVLNITETFQGESKLILSAQINPTDLTAEIRWLEKGPLSKGHEILTFIKQLFAQHIQACTLQDTAKRSIGDNTPYPYSLMLALRDPLCRSYYEHHGFEMIEGDIYRRDESLLYWYHQNKALYKWAIETLQQTTIQEIKSWMQPQKWNLILTQYKNTTRVGDHLKECKDEHQFSAMHDALFMIKPTRRALNEIPYHRFSLAYSIATNVQFFVYINPNNPPMRENIYQGSIHCAVGLPPLYPDKLLTPNIDKFIEEHLQKYPKKQIGANQLFGIPYNDYTFKIDPDHPPEDTQTPLDTAQFCLGLSPGIPPIDP